MNRLQRSKPRFPCYWQIEEKSVFGYWAKSPTGKKEENAMELANNVTTTLVKYASGLKYEDIPQDVIHMTKRVFMDSALHTL